ncbi:hypothetical protein [Halostella salina]|uniref:hypothetical protein n=1 Tax=Halostella salina TaxID=1547897 RepID=UPI000EF7CC80|nr:hypothetical protein [Halostella salina]
MSNPMKQQMARQFVQSDQFEAILDIFTEIEEETVESVQGVADAVDGVDGVEEIPTAEDRKAVLQELALAVISGEFPSWYVERLAPVDRSEEAAEFVGADPDALAQKWAERLRDEDIEGDDRELATAYVRTRYGLDSFDEFVSLVVDWDEDRVEETMEAVVAGGFERAQETADAAADELDG